jgi:hypothetical protein
MKKHRMRKYYVFVSHSAIDTWIAKQIAREINHCGAEPFLDEAAIEIGADFEEEILVFLEKAHELVVLLTPWSLERPYVWAELGAAWGRRIPIIALLLGVSTRELQSKPQIPVFLKKGNVIVLNDVDQYFLQLTKRINRESES